MQNKQKDSQGNRLQNYIYLSFARPKEKEPRGLPHPHHEHPASLYRLRKDPAKERL